MTIVGAGLAGCEAALQCAKRGVPVRLFEMRPARMTEAHQTGDVAELVCSNSLKSDEPENAHGLLKAELRVLGSSLLGCAERARIPGGKALVVDRRRFSQEVQRALDASGVSVAREEMVSLPVPVMSSEVETSLLTEETSPLATLGRGDTTVLATGPLTSQPMAEALQGLLGTEHLFFYDAIAPIVAAESLDTTRIFEGSRYGAGSDYLNCPMTEEEYAGFVDALLGAELYPLHEFEESVMGKQGTVPQAENRGQSPEGSCRTLAGTVPIFGPLSRSTNVELGAGQSPFSQVFGPGQNGDSPWESHMALRRDSPHSGGRVPFFEGCLPVEEIARRGRLALAFGPMKPVGLVDPRTPGENGGQSHGENRGTVPGSRTGPCEVTVPGFRDSPRFPKRPFAVVQLRRENAEGTMYNLVGFQTRLRQGEQQRVFRMIPGLEKATFLRFGSIHRNTYLDSPKVLLPTLQTRARPDLFIAGQLTGVEGYVESIGAGLVAGVNAAQLASGEGPVELPREMMMGSLLAYISGWGQSLGVAHGPAKGHSPRFQPMNANFGLLPACGGSKRLRGRDKRRAMAERALAAAREFGLTIRQQPA